MGMGEGKGVFQKGVGLDFKCAFQLPVIIL